MKAIVAVDLNWGIGNKGNLLTRIPEDLKYFKEMTIGKVVVMGRATFEALPNKEPLKDRINIVLSRNLSFQNESLIICRSVEELLIELKKYNAEDIFIIGGEAVYEQLLPLCEEAYVTKIEASYEADRHFVNIDKLETWKLVTIGEENEYEGIKFRFLKYVKIK